ncbi:reverse transcriptase domain-containing protein [Tanacetum coccineum]
MSFLSRAVKDFGRDFDSSCFYSRCFKSSKEPEQNPETSTEKVQNPNLENTAHVPPPEEEESIFMEIPKPKAKKTVNVEIQDLNSPRPNSYQSKLPYPERMKVRENDKPSAQHSRFLKMFKQLRLEIGLKDALVEMPKFNKWFPRCSRSAEILIHVLYKKLNRTSALANSGASINLLPHSIYKKLGLEALTPTRMTLELANRSITHPMGIAKDVIVRVDGFTFLADFVVVNFEPDQSNDVSIHKKYFHEETFQIYSNPLFEFDDNFKSSNVNPLFEENDKDAEIKSSSSFTLTSLEEVNLKLSVSPQAVEKMKIEEDKVSNFDSPFTAELSASVTLNSLGNEDKVFKPDILVYHAIHDKNLVTLEENLKETFPRDFCISKTVHFLLPPPEPPDECLNFEPILVMKNVVLNEDFYQSKKMLPLNVEDVNSFTFIIWTFLPYFTYTEESPLIFSFRSENFVFDPGIVTFHKPVACSMKVFHLLSLRTN